MVYDMDKALSYVMEHGSVMETYKLEFLLELGRDDKIPLEFFKRYQNDDGGFCFELKEGNPSSMGTTLSVLPWYSLLDVTYTGSFKRCVDFFLVSQSPDGSWDENLAIKDMAPQGMLVPEMLSTKLFLTSKISDELLYYDVNEYLVKKAILYMEQFMHKDGSFEGFPITNWLMFSIYSRIGDTKKADSIAPLLKSSMEKDAKSIIMYLDCIWRAKRENMLAEELLDALEDMQDKEGNWRTADGKKYYPNVTVDAIRVLRAWGRE
ncbi:MAG: hypothetical protein JW825_05565 [Candidatus Methanofastidiosa archaeon]|nr:hypothetical protein [Candidatus Methanofastidiosa archaeon]